MGAAIARGSQKCKGTWALLARPAAETRSPETVKSYLAKTFQKLQVRNRVEAATFVHQSPEFRR